MNTESLKICFFNSAKTWGGGEKWHLETALFLRDQGHEVTVFTNRNSELCKRAEAAGLHTLQTRITNLSFINPLKVKELTFQFGQMQFDMIIINLSADLKAAGMAAKRAGVKRIVYRRGSAIPVKNSFLNRYLYHRVITEIIANSEATKRTLLVNNSKLFPEERITVIYNGLDFASYPPLPEAPRHQEVIIGNLGRLVTQKGQDMLLKMARELLDQQVRFRLVIGGDGPLLDKLKQEVNRLGLHDVVEFKGFIADVPAFMQSLDIFVLPSHWEGFGYVIAEAMYYSKPVVAFNISSNGELIENNQSGFLVDYPNVNLLAEKTVLLISNEKLRHEMGRAGRKIVEEKFSMHVAREKLDRFIAGGNI